MFFGFTAGAFSDTIFKDGNETIAASLKKFRKDMQQKCPPSKALAFDKAFQALTVRTETRGFNIPTHVLVGDDFPQLTYDGKDKNQIEMDLDREIEEMEKKIVACEFARQKLEDSIAQNEAILGELEHLRDEQKGQAEFAKALSQEVDKVVACFDETKDLFTTN